MAWFVDPTFFCIVEFNLWKHTRQVTLYSFYTFVTFRTVSHLAYMQHCFGGLQMNQVSSYHGMETGYGGCSYGCWSGASEKRERLISEERDETEETKMLCGLTTRVRVCIFIFFYILIFITVVKEKMSCSLVPWPINNPRLLSWQLALHFCPSLPAQSPERPGLRHLGDKLPISPVEHLWGWALLQSSSSTWGEGRQVVWRTRTKSRENSLLITNT